MKNRWMLVLMVLAVLGLATGVAAQDKKREAQLRTVRGQVIDKEETPIPAGVVFLKNMRTNTVKTYIADETGQYRYSGLDPNVDYEIHAEHDNLTSSKRALSSFDTRKDITINLKVEKKKENK